MEEHQDSLMKVLQATGIILNKQKWQFHKNELIFYAYESRTPVRERGVDRRSSLFENLTLFDESPIHHRYRYNRAVKLILNNNLFELKWFNVLAEQT